LPFPIQDKGNPLNLANAGNSEDINLFVFHSFLEEAGHSIGLEALFGLIVFFY